MDDIQEVVCPQCKIGFAPDTAVCPICETSLVPEEKVSEPPAPVILADDPSSLEELRAADLNWIHHLQEKLAEAGIPHRVELLDHPQKLFCVYVRPGDYSRAKEIDAKVLAVEVPEAEGMTRVEELDFWSCPGCGHPLDEKDLKCSSCGLVLAGWDKG